jgi:protein-S-isoprenylcysteine O-methyltransferase Ste14
MAARRSGDQRAVSVARLGRLKVYEVSEAELERFEVEGERLKNGPPGQVHLSFALALLPAAFTVLITLQTVEIKNDRTYYGHWIAFWLLSVQGLVALVQWRTMSVRWWKTCDSIKTLVQIIRSRMPEGQGVPNPATGPGPGGERSS